MRSLKLWALLATFVGHQQSFGQRFSLSSDVPLTKFEEARLTDALGSTLNQIPKELINDDLRIRFRRFMESKGVRRSRLVEDCPAGIERSAMARFVEPNEIHINYDLISVLANGETLSRALKCGHPNLFRATQGAIIHALARGLSLANAGQFQNLMGFTRTWYGAIDQKNTRRDRTVDAAEFQSTSESLATNLEFYVLDSEFPCRRPAVARYFDHEFNQSRVVDRPCAAHTLVHTFSTTQRLGERRPSRTVDIDPSRIYRIDYVLVDPGEGLASGFGHSMFRIVVCAPGVEVNEECVNHPEFHLGVAYLANMSDSVISVWGGIFGKYPMQLNVIDWVTTVEAYSLGQMRSLSVYPMKLSEFEKSLFVDQVLENFWAYTGRYFFFSRNCATEIEDHLKGVAGRCTDAACGSVTPRGVTNDLLGAGVLDAAQLEVIPSGKVRRDETYQALLNCAHAGGAPHALDVTEHLNSAPNVRLGFYNRALTACSEKARQLTAGAAFLERLALLTLEGELAYQAAVALDSPSHTAWRGRRDGLTQGSVLKQMLDNREKGFPWTYLNQVGYGVPLAGDFVDENKKSDLLLEFKSWDEFMIDLGQKLFSDLAENYAETQKILLSLKSDD